MADPEKILHWKRQFASHSDAQLLVEKHQWIPSSEMHIAAVQILHERQMAAQVEALELSKKQHLEALENDKSLHKKTQLVAWIAVAVAAISAALAVPPLLLNTCPKDIAPSKSQVIPAPTTSPAAYSSSALPSATPKPQAPPPASPKQ